MKREITQTEKVDNETGNVINIEKHKWVDDSEKTGVRISVSITAYDGYDFSHADQVFPVAIRDTIHPNQEELSLDGGKG